MDVFLGKVTQQAMNYAIRSGITITAGYAIKQSSRLLKTVEGNEREELQDLQERLDSKIQIISPAIDMIELISARGNTSLESAVTLTKSLRWKIQSLGQRLARAANAEEQMQRHDTKTPDKAQHTFELKNIIQAIRKLLDHIEDAVPLINLAITASGASLSSSLPSTVSPSRLLQASTFLTAGDSQYGSSNSTAVQIGPTFILSMYMLFQGHLRLQTEDDIRDSTWKEVIHKADVRLMRVPIDAIYDLPGTRRKYCMDGTNGHNDNPASPSAEDSAGYFSTQSTPGVKAGEYAYQLVMVEDLEDDRAHTFEANEPQPEPYGDIPLAGVREAMPIHELSKIFYADTGKILNIGSEGGANRPVLLLKRDINAVPPRRMMNRYGDSDELHFGNGVPNNSAKPPTALSALGRHSMSHIPGNLEPQATSAPDPWRLPQGLDPEWIAFEVYTEAEDSDTEDETDTVSPQPSRSSQALSAEPVIASAFSRLTLGGSRTPSPAPQPPESHAQKVIPPTLPPIRTSLSLLEMLLRLLSLQQFQQTPHLAIPDELLTFFLSESASTGAASNDAQERRRLREEARRRVGFDPYDESPVKRRGEDYQYQGGDGLQRWDDEGRSYNEHEGSMLRYEDERYSAKVWTSLPNGRQPSAPGDGTPQSPLLLKNRSRSATPQSSLPSSRSRPPPLSSRDSDLRGGAARVGRGESPLARRATGMTDEALGTSPILVHQEQLKG
ncbi:MAG: hypothetical protein Q9217_003570 [Psora testacea]